MRYKSSSLDTIKVSSFEINYNYKEILVDDFLPIFISLIFDNVIHRNFDIKRRF